MLSTPNIHYHPGRKDEDGRMIINTDKFTAYVILDGHGMYGRIFVDKAMDILKPKIEKFDEEHYEASLTQIFHETNLEMTDPYYILTGSTLTVVIITATHIYTANVGDSDAYLFTKDKTMEKLTTDHSGLSFDEMMRLKEKYPTTSIMYDSKHPGKSTPVWSESNELNPHDIRFQYAKNRSYEPAIYIIHNGRYTRSGFFDGHKLAMTRSIGDYYLKEAGIIATPSISIREKPTAGEKLLVASDGFWDAWTKPELIEQLTSDPVNIFSKSVELNRLYFGSSIDDNSLIIVNFE
jgi:serine/threonine protein phosphatase PrpC